MKTAGRSRRAFSTRLGAALAVASLLAFPTAVSSAAAAPAAAPAVAPAAVPAALPAAGGGRNFCTTLGYGARCRISFGNAGGSGGGKGGIFRSPCNTGRPQDEVDCTDGDGGFWSNSLGCYVKDIPNQPLIEAGEPWWPEGKSPETHRVWWCIDENGDYGGEDGLIWTGRDQNPDTELRFWDDGDGLEQFRTLIGIKFQGLHLGSSPDGVMGNATDEDRVRTPGLVGAPVWLWAKESTEQDSDQISDRVDDTSGTGYFLTYNVDKVRFDMGDGSRPFECSLGQMTEFAAGNAYKEPGCGYKYTKPGRYWVNMWTYFDLRWRDSEGEGGQTIAVRRAKLIEIDEAQVLNK